MPDIDIDIQIREYIDGTSRPLSVDEVLNAPLGDEAVRPIVPRRTRHVSRSEWAIGIAAAAAALVLIGGPLLLIQMGRDSAPVSSDLTPATSSVPETATTTRTVESAPGEFDGPVSVVPGLGALTWERIDGDESTIPMSFTADPGGGYVSYDDGKTWRSDDGATWTVEEAGVDEGGFLSFEAQGDWAVGRTEDASHLFRRSGGEWVSVPLSEAPFPGTTGVNWASAFGFPVESDGMTVVNSGAWGAVAWDGVYGVFETECGLSEPCEMEPFVMWDPPSDTLQVRDPVDGSTLGDLTMSVDGETISFVDINTGETVHTVTGSAGYPAGRIVERLRLNEGLIFTGGWVAAAESGFEWVGFPMEWGAPIIAVPDGGFASYEFVYEYDQQDVATRRLVVAKVWTSENGIDWVDHGEPSFTDPTAEYMEVWSGKSEMRAVVATGTDDSTGAKTGDTWVSTDGLNWTKTVSVPSILSWETETDFGWVATAIPHNTYLFWVSTDRATWHKVEGPRSNLVPVGAGYLSGGAAGSVLFVGGGQDEGARTLWVGRFEAVP